MILPHWALLVTGLAATCAGVVLGRLFDPLPRAALPLALAATALILLTLGGPVLLADAIWTAALLPPLTALAVIDAATRRLPDILSFALIALGLLRLALTGAPILPPTLAAGLLILAALALDRWHPDGAIGAGDLLLAAAAVTWLGLAPLLELAIVTAILLWLQFLAQIALRFAGLLPRDRGGLPFAPAFALALLTLWAAGLPLAP